MVKEENIDSINVMANAILQLLGDEEFAREYFGELIDLGKSINNLHVAFKTRHS